MGGGRPQRHVRGLAALLGAGRALQTGRPALRQASAAAYRSAAVMISCGIRRAPSSAARR